NKEIEQLLKSTPGKVLRNPQANFDASLGASYYMDKSNWSGFGIESAEEIENWQIISPTRTAGYGTKVLNQKIQKTFRGKTKGNYIFNPNRVADEDILRYMANGEIGIHIGAYGDWSEDERKYKRPIYVAFSSQPDYAYSFKEYDFQEDGDITMELAYSITVHK